MKRVRPSDTEKDVENDVLDIMSPGRKKFWWKRISENIPSTLMDIVFFHSYASILK